MDPIKSDLSHPLRTLSLKDQDSSRTEAVVDQEGSQSLPSSLSDPCLFRSNNARSSFLFSATASELFEGSDIIINQPALIVSNVDDNDDDDDSSSTSKMCCNCGCGVPLKTSLVDEPEEEEEEESESEDEGCYLLVSSSTTNTAAMMNEKTESLTAAGTEETKPCPGVTVSAAASSSSTGGVHTVDSATGRRSFSSSVDSGRSSDTGTLGQDSLSSNSSHSGTASDDADCGVKIVSHSFCDFVGSVANENKDNSKRPREGKAKKEKLGSGGTNNRVSVFVPYSAISNYNRIVEKQNGDRRPPPPTTTVQDAFADNVVICDTQVILRINCQNPNQAKRQQQQHEEGSAQNESTVNSPRSPNSRGLGLMTPDGERKAEDDDDDDDDGDQQTVGEEGKGGEDKVLQLQRERQQRPWQKRMSRRMTTTVAVYEMLKESNLGEEEEEKARTEASSLTHAAAAQVPRKKDLCKLLGLIECDVSTDATKPEDIRVAQKMAIDNLVSTLRKERESSQLHILESKTTTGTNKKDLAKFLGVTDDTTKPRSHSTRGLLSNWGHHLAKTSSRKKASSERDSEADRSSTLASSLNRSITKEQQNVLQRTNRKNLNKFLGMDDSDSEEMVFIQNRKTRCVPGSGKESGAAANSSLNRSEQGSNSVVSVVGIKIENADGEEILDEKEAEGQFLDDDDDLSSTPTSTLSSVASLSGVMGKKSSRVSLRGFLRNSHSTSSQQTIIQPMFLKPACKSSTGHRLMMDNEGSSSLSPPRKSVIFQDYDFEDFVAQGNNNSDEASSYSKPRRNFQSAFAGRSRKKKKKKDSERRSVEILERPITLESFLQRANRDWLIEDAKLWERQQQQQQQPPKLKQQQQTLDLRKRSLSVSASGLSRRRQIFSHGSRHHQFYNLARNNGVGGPPDPSASIDGYYHHHHHLQETSFGNNVRPSRSKPMSSVQDNVFLDVFRSPPHYPHYQHYDLGGEATRLVSCNPNGRIKAVSSRPKSESVVQQQQQQQHHPFQSYINAT